MLIPSGQEIEITRQGTLALPVRMVMGCTDHLRRDWVAICGTGNLSNE